MRLLHLGKTHMLRACENDVTTCVSLKQVQLHCSGRLCSERGWGTAVISSDQHPKGDINQSLLMSAGKLSSVASSMERSLALDPAGAGSSHGVNNVQSSPFPGKKIKIKIKEGRRGRATDCAFGIGRKEGLDP